MNGIKVNIVFQMVQLVVNFIEAKTHPQKDKTKFNVKDPS